MFSNNNNLIRDNSSFNIEKYYIDKARVYRILLTTNNIKNFKETKILIDYAKQNLLKSLVYPRIKILLYSTVVYYTFNEYPIYDIFFIKNRLTIEFRVFNVNKDSFSLTENEIKDWQIIVFDDPEYDGRYIRGTNLQ